jgi:hypothetical protein
MKTSLINTIILFTIALNAMAQSTEREIAKEFYKGDRYLSIVINYIPKGWDFSASGDNFIIKCTDTVWMLEENRINAAPESREQQIKRIQSKGIRVVPQIVMHYESKWTLDKMQQSKIYNAGIEDEISKLPGKYNITGLVNKKLSSKNQVVYTGTNDKEKKLIEQYYAEKAKLEAKKMVMPDFHTEKFSLFITSTKGNNDNFHLVYPDKPSLEIYTILSTFREVCGK